MTHHKILSGLCLSLALGALLGSGGCSRQQSDWQKAREANTADAYEQFVKKYPASEFNFQAQARIKELDEERDWQKARDADTPEAYEAFLKQYPEGKWTEEARIRVENFTLAQSPSGSAAAPPTAAAAAAADPSEAALPAAAPPASATGAAPPGPPAPPSPTAAAAPVPAAKAGPYAVQLGAFKSGRQAARNRWAHLQKEYPTLFTGVSSKVSPKKTAEGSLYRLQAVGLSEKRARQVCSALNANSQACIVVPPTDPTDG